MTHKSLERLRKDLRMIIYLVFGLIIVLLLMSWLAVSNEDVVWSQNATTISVLLILAVSLAVTHPILISPDAEYASRAVARHVLHMEQVLSGINLNDIIAPDDIRINALRPSALVAWDRCLSAFNAYKADNTLHSELANAINNIRDELKYYDTSLDPNLNPKQNACNG